MQNQLDWKTAEDGGLPMTLDEKGAFASEKAQILGYIHGNYCGQQYEIY